MSICKENELCEPFKCRVPCSTGKELRELLKLPKCGQACVVISQGINGKNPCKDISCPIGNTIVNFGKNLIQVKH